MVGIKTIAAYSHANTISFCFAQTHGANKIHVGYFAVRRNFMRFDEKHGAIANYGRDSGTLF